MKRRIIPFWNNSHILSLLSGIFLGLSFPPFDLAILQFPAFIFLLRIAELNFHWREFVLNIIPAFLIWNLAGTYWLMFATIPGGLAAIAANSLLMLIPFLIIRVLLKNSNKAFRTSLLIACTWVSYEFLHHNWELAWPWLAFGNGWSNYPALVQYISFTGYLGISFWVVLSAGLGYHYLKTFKQNNLILTLFFLFLFPVFSILEYYSYEPVETDGIEVAVVQPNMDSWQDFGGMESIDELVSTLLMMSDSVRSESTDLIIWPENAIESAIPAYSPHLSRIRDSVTVWNTQLITGSGYVHYYEEADEEPLIIRQTEDQRRYNIFNAAFHLAPGRETDIYKKSKLVPVVERFPYADLLYRFDRFGWINWEDIIGYGRGSKTDNFIINEHATPALICYDSVFPQWVGDFVRNGATFLTIITNDGWWGETSGHLQHFAYARLRAIEYRRWVVRSANNGISGIISPDGDIRLATDYWTRTSFRYTITPDDQLTPYARMGNWFNWLMLAGTFIACLRLPFRKFRRDEISPNSTGY